MGSLREGGKRTGLLLACTAGINGCCYYDDDHNDKFAIREFIFRVWCNGRASVACTCTPQPVLWQKLLQRFEQSSDFYLSLVRLRCCMGPSIRKGIPVFVHGHVDPEGSVWAAQPRRS